MQILSPSLIVNHLSKAIRSPPEKKPMQFPLGKYNPNVFGPQNFTPLTTINLGLLKVLQFKPSYKGVSVVPCLWTLRKKINEIIK